MYTDTCLNRTSLGQNVCSEQTGVQFIQVILTKISYIETLFYVGLYSIRFTHVSPPVYIDFQMCLFCFLLQEHEIGLLTEITHLQDITHSLCLMAGDPQSLPSSSEQVIMDVKSSDTNSFFNNLSGVSIIFSSII